jgi:long-chain acyl-CoA synthetase
MENLATAFLGSAAVNASKPALFWAEAEFSYAHYAGQVAWVADRLAKLGVRPGDRVALWLRNCPEFVGGLFGIFGADGVAVPINNFLRPQEVGYMLDDSGATVVLAERSNPALAELLAARPGLRCIEVEDFGDSGPAPKPIRTRADLAVLIYTSGTTGRPKGAMLTHGNLLHNVESCRVMLGVIPDDRMIVLLPMFHSFMLTVGLLLPLLSGASILAVKGLNSPKTMVGEMIQRGGTLLPAMAALFRALSQLPPGVDFASLRLCVSGAGPLPLEILRAFNERHPKVPLIEGYGLSEASPVVTVNPPAGPAIPGTIGIPIPGVEVTVQDDSGAVLPDGTDGEICVRGGNVMLGYWNAPEKTAEALRNGWLLTGDIGHRRPDGWFVITDRKKDMLKPNGMNVYPREIEEVLYRFPGIREAAVVGEPCDRRGERPVAFVSLDEGRQLDEPALIAFLRDQLADYKIPRRAVVLPALPRNATGKVLKTALREMVASGR